MKDLWTQVLDQPQVDPTDLVQAIEDQVRRGDLDFRTRLLIRDSMEALEKHWGRKRLVDWLAGCPVRRTIETIWREDLGARGFPFLGEQIVETTKADAIRQFLRELGERLLRPVRLSVGGSGALILKGYLSRRTQDLDVVDEVPAEIRALGAFVRELEKRYRLQLAHFQSHYLPAGWEKRVHSIEPFGQLQACVVDVHDIFLSKLFSTRTKDFDDLRVLVPQLDKETLIRRLKGTTSSMLASDALRQQAEKNWYILYGEPLPA